MKYLLGTGFHDHGGGAVFHEEARRWYANTRRWTKPTQTVVFAQGNSKWPQDATDESVKVLPVAGDVGYVADLIERRKPHRFNGGEVGILTLAMIAYADESDLLFQEQDCLAFGPFVEQMYADLGDGGIVHGRQFALGFCGFSLFLLRHSFIPEFVRQYLGTEWGHTRILLEDKILRMDREDPEHFKILSFGYDRERPINMDDEVFYVQTNRAAPAELEGLRQKGLL